MKKTHLIILTSLILLTACTKEKPDTTKESEANHMQANVSIKEKSEFETAMKKGKEAIKDKKFDKAVAAFELALDYESDNKEAKELLNQVESYQKLEEKAKSQNLEEFTKQIDKFLKEKDLNSDLKKYAEALQKNKNDKQKEKTEKETSIWNAEKSAQLHSFMMSWGDTMGQTYKEYSPENNVNFYGLQVPDGILSGNMRPAINNEAIDLAWSKTGVGQAGYQLVAVYSDADTQDYLEKHLYLFTIHNGKPEVLVTQQNQGNPENHLNLSETQNQDLRNGFSQIISSSDIETPPSNQSNSSTVPKKYIGYWGETGASASSFELTDTHYIDSFGGDEYKITSVDESGGILTLSWDIENFIERYGVEKVGPGPQPFMCYINDDGTLDNMSRSYTLEKIKE